VTESNDIQGSREIYNNAEPEYERHYFNEDRGGFVLIHRAHQTTESDRFLARTLANIGKHVKLLSEQAPEGVRTPDADVDSEIYEFKELTEQSKSLRNRVQEGLGKARSQGAKVVVYHINRASYDIEQINRGIRQAFFWDREQQIQAISLVFQTGEMRTVTREEWENGSRF
jgi:hypothetical protein